MRELKGVASSPGSAIGPAFLFCDDYNASIPSYFITHDDIPAEYARYEAAVASAKKEIEALRDKAKKEAGEEQAAIFEAHLMMLEDPEVTERIRNELERSLQNVEFIIFNMERQFVEQLSASQDAYMEERVSDVHDVIRRILGHLMNKERINLADIDTDVILVARDLLPSDMVGMARGRIKGIATETGGRTSHAAILARAFEIPAVLGIGPFIADLRIGTQLIVDGDRGTLLVDPDESAIQKERATTLLRLARQREFSALKAIPATMKDGTRVLLNANIEVPDEVKSVVESGADGIGLFRSEFLFLGGHIPGEEDQFRAYKAVVEAMGGKPVTIRTLDIGGDKVLPELGPQDEKNPLLGWRAIRFCLTRTDVFKTQLRAILRASAFGEVKIMFPMISTLDELIRARGILEESQWECRSHGYEIPQKIRTGIMIEVPSAALCSDILARSADFFSIGTNDLTQYTLAADRGNERVSYLSEPYNPAVLRLIAATIQNAAKAGVDVSLCGEMAADPAASVLLVGMGLRNLSMSSVAIPSIKKTLMATTVKDAQNIAETVLRMTTSTQVSTFMNTRIKN